MLKLIFIPLAIVGSVCAAPIALLSAFPDAGKNLYCTGDTAEWAAQRAIKDRLKFPDSASFIYGSEDGVWSVVDKPCDFRVRVHVDAETEGGFKSRKAWFVSVVINKETGAETVSRIGWN